MRVAPPPGLAAVWHDVECGAYAADLPLWRDLAGDSGGPILELGCGTGRVALDLARRGHEVVAIDTEPALLEELARRARATSTHEGKRPLRLSVLLGDARSYRLAERFALVLAPMQLTQLLGGPCGRSAMLRRVREHLVQGGRFAAALAEPPDAVPDEDHVPPLPDVVERDGWVFSSQPVDVYTRDGVVVVERRRQLVSPRGELWEELSTVRLDLLAVDELEREARAVGFRSAGRHAIPETADHVGSTVMVVS